MIVKISSPFVYTDLSYHTQKIPPLNTIPTHILRFTQPDQSLEDQFNPSMPVSVHCKKVKVKISHYRPSVAQRVGRGIALLFHDCGTRRGEWSAARPGRTLPPGKTRYPFYRRLGGPPGPVWTGGKSRLYRNSIRDHSARSRSLYRLNYPAHNLCTVHTPDS